MDNKFTYNHHSTLCCCMSENYQTICCDGEFFMIKVYLFRSQENGNSLFLTFLIAMCGENRYVEDMRILTAIEPYLNSGFYNKHLNFISLVSKYTNVFSSIDAKLAISVWRSALDSNKTKAELVQMKPQVYVLFLSGIDFYVSLILHQFVQVQFNVIIRVLVHY